MIQTPKLHFHTYDALRFFAYLKVMLLHLPSSEGFVVYEFLKSGGGIGVCFFFVLSGFLITYILSYELLHTHKINAKNFFLRRAFRIWPLFFAGIVLAFIGRIFAESTGIDSNEGYSPNFLYSFFFLENYKMIIEDTFPDGAPLRVFWSLCVEEHFYFLWLFTFMFLKFRQIPVFLISGFVIGILARILYPIFIQNHSMIYVDLFTNLDYFCAGGLLGYYVAFEYQVVVKTINRFSLTSKKMYIFFLIAFIMVLPILKKHTHPIFDIIEPTIISIAFMFLLAIFIPIDNSLKISDTNILTRWGKISYGAYVFHTIIILILTKLFQKMGLNLDSVWILIIIAISTFLLTWLVSEISFYIFEKPFLVWREKFK